MFKLYNADCFEIMENNDLVPDESVDLILCDLPYGVTDNKWDKILPAERLWNSYLRIIKPNGAILLHSQQPFSSLLIQSQPRLYRYNWIWLKNRATGFLNCRRMPLKAFEEILVFYKKSPTYNPQGVIPRDHCKMRLHRASENYRTKDKTYSRETKYRNYPKNLLKFPCVNHPDHPTQKPVELLEYLIKTYTDPGNLVMDNCMGSGSTGVASINTGRRFVGIEMDERYYLISRKRITDL